MASSNTLNIKEKFAKYRLLKRFFSAIIMVMILVYSLYKGGPTYAAFTAVISLAVFIEWVLIVKKADTSIIKSSAKYKWYLFGLLYSLIGFSGLYFIGGEHPLFSPITFIWLIVCTTDIGAYFTGIIVGGPKIWKSASPNKTWSGFIGAIAFSLLAIFLLPYFIYINNLSTPCEQITKIFSISKHPFLSQFPLIYVIITISIVSQIGDLLESLFKRYFGVKDSSNIIPGHGGVMDRVDGLFAVIIFTMIFELISG